MSALSVTEILFDAPGTDTGHEWIELYNDESSAIPITTWKLFEANSNHSLNTARGDSSLSPGEYVIIADNATNFIAEFPSYTGDVYDSSFSLSNTGESFEIRNPSAVPIASVVYTDGAGALGDGGSLHWIGGAWNARNPNPGGSPESSIPITGQNTNQNTTNQNTGTGGSGGATQSGSGDNDSGSNTKRLPVDIPTTYSLQLSVLPQQPLTHVPVTVSPVVTRTDGDGTVTVTSGLFRVVTGDGRYYTSTKSVPLRWQYALPGTYHVRVEYRTSNLVADPDAWYETDITVINPAVTIGRRNTFITLRNEQDAPVDVSGWVVRGGGRSITLAPGTVVAASSEIALGDSHIITDTQPDYIDIVLPDGVTIVSSRSVVKPARNQSAVPTADRRAVPGAPVTRAVSTATRSVHAVARDRADRATEYTGRDYSLIDTRTDTQRALQQGIAERTVPVQSVESPPRDNHDMPVVQNTESPHRIPVVLLFVVADIILVAGGFAVWRAMDRHRRRSVVRFENSVIDQIQNDDTDAESYTIIDWTQDRLRN